MGLLHYIVYRANYKSEGIGWIMIWLLQFISCHLIAEGILWLSGKNTKITMGLMLPIMIALWILNYLLYIRKNAEKRLLMKYTNKYKWIDKHPALAFYLLILFPAVVLIAATILVNRK